MTTTLYNGDCLEVMKGIDDKSVDLILTDPPYGMTCLDYDKQPTDWETFWLEANRVIKPSSYIICFSAQPFTTEIIVSNRKNFSHEIIWCKTSATGFFNANIKPLRAHENILVFSSDEKDKNKGRTYNPQFTYSKPYIAKKKKICAHYGKTERKETINTDGKRYPLSYVNFNNSNYGSLHPNQKPVDLLSWLAKTYSNPDDVILDTYMGSGSTGVACVESGRHFVGIEINPNYYSIAEKRIAEAKMQLQIEFKEPS